MPEWADDGIQRERSGSTLPKIAPSNVYPTADGQWLIIAANQDTVFARLAAAMGNPQLADDPEYSTHTARGERQAELDELVAEFSLQYKADDLVALLNEHSVPVGKIFRVEDMLSDPQYKARRSVVEVESKEYGAVTMQNAFPGSAAPTPPCDGSDQSSAKTPTRCSQRSATITMHLRI